MPSLDHTHSYVRKGTKGIAKKEKWWKCNDPKCTHFDRRENIIGKMSLCSHCGLKEFVLTREDLERAKPRCMDCRNTKDSRSLKEKQEILSELGLI